MQREGLDTLVHRTWSALAKEVISYVLCVQNNCSYLISTSTFWLFFGRTYCLKCSSALGGTFFPFHSNFAEVSGIFFVFGFFSILHCVHHTTQASYHLWIDTGITCEEVQPWNCKNTCTASWDWMAFQTASAAQKWADMEVKWDNNFGHKNRKLPPKK